jgi:hypothetical protein
VATVSRNGADSGMELLNRSMGARSLTRGKGGA